MRGVRDENRIRLKANKLHKCTDAVGEAVGKISPREALHLKVEVLYN